MTRPFVPVRRIAALSVAITLFAAPIASAQSPDSAPSVAGSANTGLLSPAAFARLVQLPPADVTPPVVTDSSRPSLLRQATAAMARQPQAASTQAPAQKSWASRHKVATVVIIGVGALIGGLVWLGASTAWLE